jgi:magnesium chelatase subunit D
VFESAETKSVSTPFGAVVGQEALKEALLTVAIDEGLDGLLVTGEKGTAKSTLVRGLAALLPDQRAVADCPYGCPPGDRERQCAACRERATYPVETRPVPLVTLPLGATRERVVGSLSVSDALDGEASFDPGLLARANRGLLYVDEVNLLDDHLVDVLLDAAAAGENRVERDGVSVAHPAAFTLVGTMNPEEGDLRPQLRDRFALSVGVHGERDVDRRVAIIDEGLGRTDGAATDDDHEGRLRRARGLLPSVELDVEQKRDIAELCLEAGVDGHRADIATARAARALAALDGRPTVVEGDVRRAAELALAHRMRSTPFEDAPDAESVVEDHFDDSGDADGGERATGDDADPGESSEDGRDGPGEETDATPGEGPDEPGDETDGASEEGPDRPDKDSGEERPEGGRTGGDTPADDGRGVGADEQQEAPEGSEASGRGGDADAEDATPLVPGAAQAEEPATARAPDLEPPAGEAAAGTGRAAASPGTDGRGPRVGTEPAEEGGGVDAAASARAAVRRGGDGIGERDLRQSVRAGDGEALVVFAVDASASMRPAMRQTEAVTLELLEDAYTERDSVAVVAFAGTDAEVLLPPTDSVTLAARHLKRLPTGDRTPLPAGLRTAADLLERADPDAAVVVVVSDGRANAAADPTAETRAAAAALAATGAGVVCVDAGSGRGLLDAVVDATDGDRIPLDALTPERVERTVAAARR